MSETRTEQFVNSLREQKIPEKEWAIWLMRAGEQLERELAAKSAEVERLLDQLAEVDEEGGALRDVLVAIAQPGITLKAAQHAAREAIGWYAE